MTRTIRMKDIAGLKANSTTAPYATTDPAKIGGVRGDTPVDPPPDLPEGILFQESFDDLPDYSSDDSLPANFGPWDEMRQGGYEHWSPGTGHPDRRPAFMITGENPDWVRGGTGKAFVAHRESYTGSGVIWNSDGILSSVFDGTPTLYVCFYIKFQPGWTEGGQSKFFRASSYDGGPRFGFGTEETDSHGPMVLWDYGHGGELYGVRNFLSLRGGPNTSNYFWAESGNPPNLPRNMNNGDLTCNFEIDVTDPGDGTTNPPYISKVTGNPVGPAATHADVYGTDWNKIEFYMEMNSAPGVADGVLRQRINDIETFKNLTMPWVASSGPTGKLWNHLCIGGNDNWTTYPNEDRVEEWYAIDDLIVSTDRPGDWV